MFERLLEAVQAVRGKPIARVVVVDLATGGHDCYELRPGSFLVLEVDAEAPALVRLTRRKGAEARAREGA